MQNMRQAVQEIISEWIAEQTKANVRKTIRRLLDDNLETVIADVAGFTRTSDGKWEPHYYRGPATEWINAVAQETVKQFLDEHLKSELPALTKGVCAGIIEEYKDRVLRVASDYTMDTVREQVQETMDDMIEQVAESVDIESLRISEDEEELNNEQPVDPWDQP